MPDSQFSTQLIDLMGVGEFRRHEVSGSDATTGFSSGNAALMDLMGISPAPFDPGVPFPGSTVDRKRQTVSLTEEEKDLPMQDQGFYFVFRAV